MTPSMIVVFSSTSMIAAAFSFRKVAKVCSSAVSLSSCVAIGLPFTIHLAHRPVLLYPITICLTIWIGLLLVSPFEEINHKDYSSPYSRRGSVICHVSSFTLFPSMLQCLQFGTLKGWESGEERGTVSSFTVPLHIMDSFLG